MSREKDKIAPRPRVPKGVRPGNLDDERVEQVLYMLLALTTEVSALRDRAEDLARYMNADGRALDEFLANNPRTPRDTEAASAFRRDLFDAMFRILREDLAGGADDETMKTYRKIMEQAASSER